MLDIGFYFTEISYLVGLLWLKMCFSSLSIKFTWFPWKQGYSTPFPCAEFPEKSVLTPWDLHCSEKIKIALLWEMSGSTDIFTGLYRYSFILSHYNSQMCYLSSVYKSTFVYHTIFLTVLLLNIINVLVCLKSNGTKLFHSSFLSCFVKCIKTSSTK